MKFESFSLQIARPREFCRALGQWIRAERQRAEQTQAMLAKRAGVPSSSLSRLEMQGAGSLELVAKTLVALGKLDGLNDFVKEQNRMALLPKDISELARSSKITRRVRPKRKEGRL